MRVVEYNQENDTLKEIDTCGKAKSDWKLISILDCKGYSTCYTEELGLITKVVLCCVPVDKDGKQLQNAYANYNPHTNRKTNDLYWVHSYSSYSIDTIFDSKFYKCKTQPRQSYHYTMLKPIQIDDAEEITDIRYSVEITYYIVDVSGNSTYVRKNPFIISNKKELQDITVWATKYEVKTYTMPVLMDLQKGQKYYYIGQGVCEVVKIYDYPNKQSNIICKVVFSDGTKKDIVIGDRAFVYIPLYHKNELLQFNESKNELKLQPITQRKQEHNLINVMWQPIEDASRYIVKLYRYVNTDNRRKVYFLKDYEVDRNEHFLSINDLIVDGHIVVVVAENRSGNIVAQSRGIDVAVSKGEPKWF